MIKCLGHYSTTRIVENCCIDQVLLAHKQSMTFFFLSPFYESATSGGILDRAIEAEDKKHGDFMRLVILVKSFFCYSSVLLFDCIFRVLLIN